MIRKLSEKDAHREIWKQRFYNEYGLVPGKKELDDYIRIKEKGKLRNYAIEYKNKDTGKTDYELYIAPTKKDARDMFKKDFGNSKKINFIEER